MNKLFYYILLFTFSAIVYFIIFFLLFNFIWNTMLVSIIPTLVKLSYINVIGILLVFQIIALFIKDVFTMINSYLLKFKS